jgi:purine-nucleoside phosphorylase
LVVLGSGLSHLTSELEGAVEIPFADLPGFPAPGVSGHAGRYLAGRLDGRRVLMQAGRYHLYEGLPPDVVCGPVRVAHRLGVHTVLLTNAAGGVNPSFSPGAIVALQDHLNFTGVSPLAGPVAAGEERFPDMSAPYDPGLLDLADAAARALRIPLLRGVYAAVLGPSFETPAEVRWLARCGADLVGMSTVPEVIVARALGLRCLAFSLVTNKAAGLSDGPLSHEEVLESGRVGGRALGSLLRRVVRDMVE